jgi:predicted restriction endonuclease
MQIENEMTDLQASKELPKQHLISNEKFQLLKECQQKIFLTTEISPSMRKIINELITEENLQTIQSKFISILS